MPTYATVDRIIKDLKPKGKSHYVPPYPEESYFPEHLKGLKDMVVFIPQNSESVIPSIEEIAKGKFMLENPEGISLSPPGVALLTQFEKQMGTDITKLELTELCESLSRLILEQFQLAKEIEIKPEENGVHIRITDSIYAHLYNDEHLKSVHLLGCPLVSAIACAVAKTTGKVVTIQKDKVLPENQMIEVWLHIVQE
jgi:hypothetical protein